MNADNVRLREIQQYKRFYKARLSEDNTELERDLLTIKYEQLETEEKEILERCDVKIWPQKPKNYHIKAVKTY